MSRTAWRAYETIAESLRARITSGALVPGTALPSENALAAAYGVVRNTVRRALAVLEDDGLITTLPGRGRVVRAAGTPSAAADALPRYRRIADALREEIEAGALAPGEPLPSESTLMAAHGVSRGTARRALGDLEGAGLIESRQGRGRFVRAR